MRQRTVEILFVLAAACWMSSCGLNQETLAAPVARVDEVTVAVSRAVRSDMSRELTLTGELTPFQEVEVMAKVAGYVQSINVDVGDVVRKGQALAVLEMPEMQNDLARARAAIQRSTAEMRRAEEEATRAETSHQIAHLTYSRLANVSKAQPGLVAQQEIDDALAKDQVADAQLAVTKSALVVATEQIKIAEAEKEKVETLLQYARVTAPFDGVVTRRYANNGAMIQAGVASQSQAMPVVRLSQHDLLRLVVPVPESAAGVIKPGSTVEVSVPSLQRTFSGTVARSSEQVDTSTRTMRVEVDVPNPRRILIPGMYAEVRLPVARSTAAVVIPIPALDRDADGESVLVVGRDGEIQKRRVVTGLANPTHVQVVSGVKEGDMVVVAGRGQLKHGQRVRMKEMKEGDQPVKKAVG